MVSIFLIRYHIYTIMHPCCHYFRAFKNLCMKILFQEENSSQTLFSDEKGWHTNIGIRKATLPPQLQLGTNRGFLLLVANAPVSERITQALFWARVWKSSCGQRSAILMLQEMSAVRFFQHHKLYLNCSFLVFRRYFVHSLLINRFLILSSLFLLHMSEVYHNERWKLTHISYPDWTALTLASWCDLRVTLRAPHRLQIYPCSLGPHARCYEENAAAAGRDRILIRSLGLWKIQGKRLKYKYFAPFPDNSGLIALFCMSLSTVIRNFLPAAIQVFST